jgi:hypothetical protein
MSTSRTNSSLQAHLSLAVFSRRPRLRLAFHSWYRT